MRNYREVRPCSGSVPGLDLDESGQGVELALRLDCESHSSPLPVSRRCLNHAQHRNGESGGLRCRDRLLAERKRHEELPLLRGEVYEHALPPLDAQAPSVPLSRVAPDRNEVADALIQQAQEPLPRTIRVAKRGPQLLVVRCTILCAERAG